MTIFSIQGDSLWFEIQKLEGLLGENVQRLQHIQSNTTLDFVDDGLNLLGVISVIIAVFALFIEAVTWMGITGTRESIISEAEKNRVYKECQYRLFQDIIRHLYRNKVCVLTMQAKLKHAQEQHAQAVAEGKVVEGDVMFYPSEEHILKLKLLTSDIHLEEYYRESDTYYKLHEMELLLRNYNTEIDSAFIHIPNARIDAATKARDFNTLNFKTAYLTFRIVELMDEMWADKQNLKDAQQIIRKAQMANAANNKVDEKVKSDYLSFVDAFVAHELQDDNVKRIFADAEMEHFREGLIADLLIECGGNARGEEKIHIIEQKI